MMIVEDGETLGPEDLPTWGRELRGEEMWDGESHLTLYLTLASVALGLSDDVIIQDGNLVLPGVFEPGGKPRPV